MGATGARKEIELGGDGEAARAQLQSAVEYKRGGRAFCLILKHVTLWRNGAVEKGSPWVDEPTTIDLQQRIQVEINAS